MPITGHRPKKLYGYNLSAPEYTILKEKLKMILKIRTNGIHRHGAWNGYNLCKCSVRPKKEGMGYLMVAAVPCAKRDKKWSKKDQKRYQEILQAADDVVQLSEEEYRPELVRG